MALFEVGAVGAVQIVTVNSIDRAPAGLLLTKLLPLFIYPLGAALLAGATAHALTFTSWRRSGQVLLGFALVVLWIAATPFFANWLNWQLESQFRAVDRQTLPQSDVAIILGGASDRRIVGAMRIYRLGKAPLILISAGNLPWDGGPTESQQIADFLVELGVPRSALRLESASRTTRENAVNTAALFREYNWHRGLLVTSGNHMPRALAAFRKVGVDVVPAAVDFRAGPARFNTVLDLLPDAGALAWATSAIKEIVGLYVYRYRGWV